MADAQPALSGERVRRPIPRPETVIDAALAQKVLGGWIQNRYQTLYPLVIAWKNMAAPERQTILAAIALALDAGEPDGGERPYTWLHGIGAEDTAIAALRAGDVPLPTLGAFANAVRKAGLAPQAYAAAVGALGRRAEVNWRLQAYLASRLGVSDTVARSLNRRYGG